MFLSILAVVILLGSAVSQAKSAILSAENFSSASLTIAFDRIIKLNKSNNFRFPVKIDSNNKCTLHSTQPIVIRNGTEWKSEPRTDWNDWDLKRFSFKLTNRNKIVTLNCDLNLSGEILLFNADKKRKAINDCIRQGGRAQSSPPSTLSQLKVLKPSRVPSSALVKQTYCVKRIPKLKSNRFKNAFAKSSISVQIEFSNENAEVPL